MPRPHEPLLLPALNRRFGNASAEAILAVALDRFEGRIALVSSFGAEAAVLLHMLAQVDKDVPVLILDTLLLFEETLEYQQRLSTHLGLRDVRPITPDESQDPERNLHQSDTTACCALRKAAPLEKALTGFDAVITGRKRHQAQTRRTMASFEQDSKARARINPLAHWSAAQVEAYFITHDLPRHPLVKKGYLSIGCAPCTTPVQAGEDPRAGRWRAEERTECGIHLDENGGYVRKTG